MTWQPPSEHEFNDEWFTVEDALGSLVDIIEPWHKKRWLIERLKAGLIIGVARTGQPNERLNEFAQFVPVRPKTWQTWDDSGDEHFWETGGENAIFYHYGPGGAYGGATPQRFFDVRFDPRSFSGRPPATPLEDEPPAAATVDVSTAGLSGEAEYRALTKALEEEEGPSDLGGEEPEAEPRALAELGVLTPAAPVLPKDISVDEAKRFSRAILEGWPNSSEEFAHKKAVLFFPDNKVPRDWFKRIFRSIRGPKNRGKVPKIRN